MQHDVPLILRFISKLVLDILPAALASLIGGFLFTQYHYGHGADAKPKLVQVTPASEEMMRLVRDEHAMMIDFLKAQMAAEKSKQASQRDAQVRAIAAAAKANAEAFNMRHVAETAPAARPASPQSKMQPATRVAAAPSPAAAPSSAAVPAQAAAPSSGTGIAAGRSLELSDSQRSAERPRDPDPFVATAGELKDNIVAATRKVVTTIVDIPSWIASMADRSTNAAVPPMADSAAGRFVGVSW
jgi:hypothetical protein